MRFKKIYIEITNSCNFNCSFCFITNRKKRNITIEEFEILCSQVRPFTDYIYLHVLGEPLLHPHFEIIISKAQEQGFQINLVTNGSLLIKKQDYLFNNPIRQINISLHDAEENIRFENRDEYLHSILKFCNLIGEKTIICLRLWNSTNISSTSFNKKCIQTISNFFDITINENQISKNGLKLRDKLYLEAAPRFEWPDKNEEGLLEKRNCYAMRDQVAILSNGDVVPCCLDADGIMKLGNIYLESFEDIINSEKALKIKNGFEQRKIVEPLCKTCGFIV